MEGARDRLLIDGESTKLAALAGWSPPRLPLGGGALIAMGLPAGVIVARTLAAIEARWVAEGFPDDATAIARDEVRHALDAPSS